MGTKIRAAAGGDDDAGEKEKSKHLGNRTSGLVGTRNAQGNVTWWFYAQFIITSACQLAMVWWWQPDGCSQLAPFFPAQKRFDEEYA